VRHRIKGAPRAEAAHQQAKMRYLVWVAYPLFVLGFDGTELPTRMSKRLQDGWALGTILFRRNIVELDQVRRLTAASHAARASHNMPALVSLDQEGGRVRRIGEPLLRVPPMLALEHYPKLQLRALARAVARELAALGFTMNYAPILDVLSNPNNPVIGDRAFGRVPETATERGLLFADGLLEGGILPCGKHFPGHGDTQLDSHHALPVLHASRDLLNARELVPFRAAAAANLPALMTAHVVLTALDATCPATLSQPILQGLLRKELGYRGAVLSDDLEMRALSGDPGELAVQAIAAGCDVLLICRSEAAQEAAIAAVAKESERSSAFRARCIEAAARAVTLATHPLPEPSPLADLLAAHAPLQEELDRFMAQAAAQPATHVASPSENRVDPTEFGRT
jgi:beta-N-acetylhexosaminidase